MASTGTALAQAGPAAPPTTITTPPRDFPYGAPTTYFWDPDIFAIDPAFNDLAQPNTAIKRLYTGVLGRKVRRGTPRAGSGVERYSQQPANALV